jgi:hypothetical protein
MGNSESWSRETGNSQDENQSALHQCAVVSTKERNVHVVIEKNVPIPTHAFKKKGLSAMFRAMEVGDSFSIREDHRANLTTMAKRVGIRVTVRKIDAGMCRVWRVE